MQIKINSSLFYLKREVTLSIMRLLIFILMLSLCSFSPETAISQNAKIFIKNDQILTVKQVFDLIRHQTKYSFVYPSDKIKALPKVEVKKGTVEVSTLLNRSLNGTTYTFEEGPSSTIIITPISNVIFVKTPINQQRIINGKVIDKNGVPLAGAMVKIKGSRTGVVTDFNGFYSIEAKTDDILIISYIGFATKETKIDSGSEFNIVLVEESNALNEIKIVSTGYQTLPKERVTGSFKIIDREQIDKPATNIGQRLIGTTAGLVATSDVNGNPTFTIRGVSTLTPNANPLIVLDGFPLESSSFSEINPNNVESITVLKDAAAASIWGSRSANGVIVITTKSGKKGTPFTADITTFIKIGSKMDLDYVRPLASSAETVAFEKSTFGKWNAIYNSGTLNNLTVGPSSQATDLMNEYKLGRITLQQRDNGLARLSTLDNSQQIRDLILDTPITNMVNLNITGGSARTNHSFSGLFENNTTNFKGNDNKRTMLNYRMNADVSKWLNFDLGMMVRYQKSNINGFNYQDLNSWSPYDMLVNGDGSQVEKFPMGYYMPSLELLVNKNKFPYDFYYNPLREMNARDITNESLYGRIQVGLTANIIQGLTVSSTILYENSNLNFRALYSEDSYLVRSSVNNSLSWNGNAASDVRLNLPLGSQLDQNRSKGSGYNFRNQLNFSRSFAKYHTVNFVAGTELRENISESFNYPRTYGYNDDRLTVGQFPNGPGGAGSSAITSWLGRNVTFPYTNSFSYTNNRYYSLFSNLAYTFNKKYTVSGSYRTDASNFIAANDKARYSPFWSVGGLWHANKENFFKNTTWLDKLSFRFTYGINGNEDRSTSPFPLISIASTPNPYTSATSATISSFGNSLLRWERTYTFNAGIDFSIFNGKLFGSIDAYRKNGKDLLASVSIPIVNGTTSQRLNNVEMYNRGIEIDLGSSLQITKNIRWRGNVNFAYNDNKITKLFRVQYTSANLVSNSATGASYVEGMNANSLWSYKYGGFVNGNPVYIGPDNQPVNFGILLGTDARSWMQQSGVTVAPYTLGFSNSFDVYNFSLSAIVTGKFGHVFRRTSFNYPVQSGLRLLPNARLSEVQNGDSADILTLPTANNYALYGQWASQYPTLDYLVENASHIRLQEVNLSYNLPNEVIRKAGFKGLRLFLQGNNLLTVKDNKYNEDPEFLMGTPKPAPTYTFGLNLQF